MSQGFSIERTRFLPNLVAIESNMNALPLKMHNLVQKLNLDVALIWLREMS